MTMIAFIVGIFYILGILSAIHAVMSTRTPQGAIAWSVSLVTFPFIAVPAYWILGRNKFQGYVIARQEELERIASVSQRAESELTEIAAIVDVQRADVLGAERLARLPATRGNHVKLLVDGEATFSSILEGIGVAEKYVLVQFYIVHDDGIGRELKAKLIAKAKEGVQVHFCTMKLVAQTFRNPTWMNCAPPGSRYSRSIPAKGRVIASRSIFAIIAKSSLLTDVLPGLVATTWVMSISARIRKLAIGGIRMFGSKGRPRLRSSYHL